MKYVLIPIAKIFMVIAGTIIDSLRYILLTLFHMRLPKNKFLMLGMDADNDYPSNEINWNLFKIWDLKHW
jgi:hypothetical protein